MVPSRKVLIDGYNLALEKGTGVATYGRNLSHECHRLGFRTEALFGKRMGKRRSPLLTEVAFFDPDPEPVFVNRTMRDAARVLRSFTGQKSQSIPLTGDVISQGHRSQLSCFDAIWNISSLFETAEARFGVLSGFTEVSHPEPVDIMHWTYPVPVRMRRTKNIYTLHDLVPLRLPFTTLDRKPYYHRLLRRIVKTADHLVTVSETSRKDIIRLFDCPEEKITNTYQTVRFPKQLLEKSDDDVRAEIEGAFGLPYKGYVLFFGAIEPKKNIGRLLEAYLSSGIDAPLVLIGPRAWKSEQELRWIEGSRQLREAGDGGEVKAGMRVIHFDYAPVSLLVSAIRGAMATTFPSLYEGFGLPVLESMLLGTPVLTSRGGATEEVAGDAAFLVDPYDVPGMAAAIRQLCCNPALRASLAAAGRLRAEYFSPPRYRDRLSRMYDHVMSDAYPNR